MISPLYLPYISLCNQVLSLEAALATQRTAQAEAEAEREAAEAEVRGRYTEIYGDIGRYVDRPK